MSDRSFEHNAGFISLVNHVPDDEYIAGVVVISINDNGDYSSRFIPESLDEVPSPEVQETLGAMIAQAFEIANINSGAPRA